MTKARSILVATVLLANALPAFAQNGTVVGHIKSATGSVVIVRQNSSIPAKVGEPIECRFDEAVRDAWAVTSRPNE